MFMILRSFFVLLVVLLNVNLGHCDSIKKVDMFDLSVIDEYDSKTSFEEICYQSSDLFSEYSNVIYNGNQGQSRSFLLGNCVTVSCEDDDFTYLKSSTAFNCQINLSFKDYLFTTYNLDDQFIYDMLDNLKINYSECDEGQICAGYVNERLEQVSLKFFFEEEMLVSVVLTRGLP